jgi:hypothetical protein
VGTFRNSVALLGPLWLEGRCLPSHVEVVAAIFLPHLNVCGASAKTRCGRQFHRRGEGMAGMAYGMAHVPTTMLELEDTPEVQWRLLIGDRPKMIWCALPIACNQSSD